MWLPGRSISFHLPALVPTRTGSRNGDCLGENNVAKTALLSQKVHSGPNSQNKNQHGDNLKYGSAYLRIYLHRSLPNIGEHWWRPNIKLFCIKISGSRKKPCQLNEEN